MILLYQITNNCSIKLIIIYLKNYSSLYLVKQPGGGGVTGVVTFPPAEVYLSYKDNDSP